MTAFILSLASLCLLIFVHELGHFLFAKWHKVGVHEFAIGFGPKALSFTYGETLYSLRWIPLGGYVRMAGETSSELEKAEKDLVTFPPDRYLQKKKVWQRASIVFAGPLFNILFAIVATFLSLVFYGTYDIDEVNKIGAVIPGSNASKSGLQDDDIIVAINETKITSWKDIVDKVRTSGGEVLKFAVKRANVQGGYKELEVVVNPSLEDGDMQFIEGRENEEKRYHIGIMAPYKRTEVAVLDAPLESINLVYFKTHNIIKSIYGLLTGHISSDKIGGPIQILSIASAKAKKSFDEFVMLTIQISLSLAIFNLLPIPILDGGHLLFLAFEGVFRRPIPENIQGLITNTIGLVVILGIFLLAMYNDISRLIMG